MPMLGEKPGMAAFFRNRRAGLGKDKARCSMPVCLDLSEPGSRRGTQGADRAARVEYETLKRTAAPAIIASATSQRGMGDEGTPSL
jgi:hypothetical protein